jgi:ADP-ribose pyrophosphatase YjhB (NUDIX family)
VLRIIYLIYKVYLFVVRPLTFGVRVMLVRAGEVLLVRQTYMDGWFIPGGGILRGETLDQAARREVREEVRAELKSLRLVGVYSNFEEWKSDHNVLFYSDDFTLAGGHDQEVAEMRFFPLDSLPSGLWPGHRRRLEEYLYSSRANGGDSSTPGFGEW